MAGKGTAPSVALGAVRGGSVDQRTTLPGAGWVVTEPAARVKVRPPTVTEEVPPLTPAISTTALGWSKKMAEARVTSVRKDSVGPPLGPPPSPYIGVACRGRSSEMPPKTFRWQTMAPDGK